jgi:hypothetical protein
MKKLESFYKIANIGLIIIMLFLEGGLRHWIEDAGLEKQKPIIFVIAIILLIALFKFFEWLIELAVEEIAFIRRWILRDEYLEGVWCDRSIVDEQYCYALLTITFENGMYFVNGSQYYADGSEHHSWNTIVSKFENHTIRFLYRSIYFREKEDEYMGYSSFTFEKMNLHHYPTSYTGKYKDFGKDAVERPFKGYKILDKELLDNLNTPQNQKKTLLKIIQVYFGEP